MTATATATAPAAGIASRTAPAPPVLCPGPGPAVPDCFIAHARPRQGVLVALHGSSGHAETLARRLAAEPALARTTIIVPQFDPALLACPGPGQTAAAAALLALLEHLASTEHLPLERVALFGISLGAQLAQRFALRHPRRIRRLCLVAAESYAMPLSDVAWPHGIGDGAGQAVIAPDFLAIPTTVIVGNRDTRIDALVRQDPAILAHQGHNRLRRARCYVRAIEAMATSRGEACATRLLTLHGIWPELEHCLDPGALIALAAQALLDADVSSNRPSGAHH